MWYVIRLSVSENPSSCLLFIHELRRKFEIPDFLIFDVDMAFGFFSKLYEFIVLVLCTVIPAF